MSHPGVVVEGAVEAGRNVSPVDTAPAVVGAEYTTMRVGPPLCRDYPYVAPHIKRHRAD